ncbi:H/ACA ribonucleoprotein complex non-core subunit NAF1-like [Ornithodoros turicata]|uniref:H/ACA ribonucleoprotein complex non-core subunit NAF1-like n=1 Tax=Ornithodoros turicata TaxID=34597 RepID=UPI003138E6B5
MATMESEESMDIILVEREPCHDEIVLKKGFTAPDDAVTSSVATVLEEDDVEIVQDVTSFILNHVAEVGDDEVSIVRDKSEEIVCIADETNGVSGGEVQARQQTNVVASCDVEILTTARLVPYRDDATSDSDTESDSETTSSDSDSDSDTTSDESSSSSSDDDVVVVNAKPGEKRKTSSAMQQPQKCLGIKTPGELDITDLPPIEDLRITVPKEELHPVGRVYNMVDQLLVIESIVGQPILDLDSVLFRTGGEPIGQVFDVFGPVSQPYYVIRFNKPEDIAEKKYEKGEPVYYAPLHADMTQYVFVSELRKIKGSDASWEHNNEPPPEHIDYSDDEQEREARRKRKGAQKETGNVWRKTDNSTKSRSETNLLGSRKPGCADAAPKRQFPVGRSQNMSAGSRPHSPDVRNSGPTFRPDAPNGQQSPHSWHPPRNVPPFPPPRIPLPRWMCSPPPQFGSPCRWPNGPSPDDQQRMRQLWSSPPPPIGPPSNGYPGGLSGSPWSMGPPPLPPPPISHGGPPVWSQLYDPVPDLQRILMTPPPPLP